MSFLKRKFALWLPVAFFALLPLVSFGQSLNRCEEGKVCNPISSDSLSEVITKFLEGALKIGMPIVALAVIYCGFLFVKARGNSEEISKAKEALTYTLIGAGILLGATALAQLINETVKAL